MAEPKKRKAIELIMAVEVRIDSVTGELLRAEPTAGGLFYDAEARVWDPQRSEWRDCESGEELEGCREARAEFTDLIHDWSSNIGARLVTA